MRGFREEGVDSSVHVAFRVKPFRVMPFGDLVGWTVKRRGRTGGEFIVVEGDIGEIVVWDWSEGTVMCHFVFQGGDVCDDELTFCDFGSIGEGGNCSVDIVDDLSEDCWPTVSD